MHMHQREHGLPPAFRMLDNAHLDVQLCPWLAECTHACREGRKEWYGFVDLCVRRLFYGWAC